MNTFEAIKTRKSVRTYLDRSVETEKIRTVVEAGNMAAGTPMAGKVYFNVIGNQELLKELSENTKAVMGKSGVEMLVNLSAKPEYNPIYGAPVAVVISTDKAADSNTLGMATANAACAAENMLLAATELGLGSCYLMTPVMAFNIPTMRESTKLPNDAQPVAVVVFGYTNDIQPHKEYPNAQDTITYIV